VPGSWTRMRRRRRTARAEMAVLTVAAFERAASKPKRVQSRVRLEAAPPLVAGGRAAVFASVGALELEPQPPQPQTIRGAIARMACSARLIYRLQGAVRCTTRGHGSQPRDRDVPAGGRRECVAAAGAGGDAGAGHCRLIVRPASPVLGVLGLTLVRDRGELPVPVVADRRVVDDPTALPGISGCPSASRSTPGPQQNQWRSLIKRSIETSGPLIQSLSSARTNLLPS
jgi:hypothetical protein